MRSSKTPRSIPLEKLRIAAELGNAKNKIRDLENQKTELEKQFSSLELYAGELSVSLEGLKTENKSLSVSIQKKEVVRVDAAYDRTAQISKCRV